MGNNIDLDFDTDLGSDATSFGISAANMIDNTVVEAEPIAHLPVGTVSRGEDNEGQRDEVPELTAAVVLAMEACQWELTFYTWGDEYLHGVKQEAIADIPIVRDVLRQERNYWGPCYFTTRSEKAKVKYYGLMAAQAALGAVERHNKLPLIEKVIYYSGIVEGSEGI